MDNQRLLVWSFFGFMLFLTWQAWMEDYGPRPQTPAVSETATAPESASSDIDDLPAMTSPAAGDAPALNAANDTDAPVPDTDSSAVVTVVTDVLDVEISSRGATLQKAVLLKYPVSKDEPDVLVQMLSPAAESLGLLQTGLRISGREDEEPNHRANFSAEL